MPLPDGRVCTTCGEYRTKENFYLGKRGRLRAKCKDCSNEESLLLYRKKREAKDIKFYASRMASAAIQRVSNDHENNSYYRKNSIKNRFETHEDFTDYIIKTFSHTIEQLLDEGATPSLDRINPKGNYEPNNIRVIDIELNRTLGRETLADTNRKRVICTYPNGEKRKFNSVKEAHEVTKLDRATIRRSFMKNVRTKAGFSFELLDERQA